MSLVNRNRRVWNELTRKTNSTVSREERSIDHTPSCVTSDSSQGTTLAEDRYLSSVVPAPGGRRVCEDEATQPPCDGSGEAADSDIDDLRRARAMTSQLMAVLNSLYWRRTSEDQ